VKVKPDEKIYDVYYKMAKAVVGIVVDEIGKPTHCFTKLDLQNALAAWK
jgi:predicted transcriptional regulator